MNKCDISLDNSESLVNLFVDLSNTAYKIDQLNIDQLKKGGSQNSSSLALLLKTHSNILRNIYDELRSGQFSDDLVQELEKRQLHSWLHVMYFCAVELIESGQFEKSLQFLSKSPEYAISSKDGINSPVDLAMTSASVSYLTNKNAVSEIEMLYKSAIDLSKNGECSNSKKYFSSLNVLILLIFIIKKKVNLKMISEFYSKKFFMRDDESFSRVVRDFMGYLGYSIDFSKFDSK